MLPLLIEGKSHVIIAPLSEPLRVGDLPIYLRQDGKYVIHRLIRIDEQHCFTRGDNCVTHEKVPHSWVLGKVIEINRRGKTFPVTAWGYRVYSRIWHFLFPARKLIFKVKKILKRIFRIAGNNGDSAQE